MVVPPFTSKLVLPCNGGPSVSHEINLLLLYASTSRIACCYYSDAVCCFLMEGSMFPDNTCAASHFCKHDLIWQHIFIMLSVHCISTRKQALTAAEEEGMVIGSSSSMTEAVACLREQFRRRKSPWV